MITEGGELLLTCNATGNPAPSISWTKDGFLINGSGDPRISFTEQNTNLSVTNVSRADVGQYRCVASNSLGNTSSNAAILDVQCKFTGSVDMIKLIFAMEWSRYMKDALGFC